MKSDVSKKTWLWKAFGVIVIVCSVSLFYSCETKKTSLEVFEQNGLYGYKNSDSVIIQPIYTFAAPFKDGIAKVMNNKGSVLFIDTNGKIVGIALPESKMEIKVFELNGLYGYKKGDSVIIQPIYTFAEPFKDGKAKVVNDKGYVLFIDTNGKIVGISKSVQKVQHQNK